MCKRAIHSLAALTVAVALSGCGTAGRGETQYGQLSASRGNAPGGGNTPAERQRAAEIAAEPRGNHYIGRRYHVDRTRFWGYLRRPGEPWQSARLVVMNERRKYAPDRLPELPAGGGRGFSFDHNHEYRIYGHYSGRTVYDPNANLFLPEFVLTDYELISASPGWLFAPGESYEPGRMPWVPGR